MLKAACPTCVAGSNTRGPPAAGILPLTVLGTKLLLQLLLGAAALSSTFLGLRSPAGFGVQGPGPKVRGRG